MYACGRHRSGIVLGSDGRPLRSLAMGNTLTGMLAVLAVSSTSTISSCANLPSPGFRWFCWAYRGSVANEEWMGQLFFCLGVRENPPVGEEGGRPIRVQPSPLNGAPVALTQVLRNHSSRSISILVQLTRSCIADDSCSEPVHIYVCPKDMYLQ